MLNEYKICPRCHCNSAYVVSIYNSTSQPTFMRKYVCHNCGYEFDEHIFQDQEKSEHVSDFIVKRKEESTIKVSYNGFTGELVKLERVGTGKIAETIIPIDLPGASCEHVRFYNLSIYDSEKEVTHSFTGVKLEDVKFLGGAVSFGG